MSDALLVQGLAGRLFRRADVRRDERAAEPLRPAENFLRNLWGWWPPARESARAIARWSDLVSAQAELALVSSLTDSAVADQFRAAMLQVKHAPRPGRATEHLALVFACIAEASRRCLGLWPYPVQLAGARALMVGELLEMQTGEGKTLVAALAATAMAGGGASVHVVSTNDYLARRDNEEMSALFRFFGLYSACIQGGMSAAERRAAYAQDICYTSGKELVFDYLKDRLSGHGVVSERVAGLHDLLMPQPSAVAAPLIPALHFVIVDEADSVLIDEARTPMILSREAPPVIEPEMLTWAIHTARQMQMGRDFRIGSARDLDLLAPAASLTGDVPAGVRPVWASPAWREHLVRQALSALHLYHRDQHYILSESKVQIVDESTGRVMPDRSWEQGLHQLIETKEGLPLTSGRETIARMTYQRFFRRYYLMAGLTGTAAEASRELWTAYRIRVRRLPPHRPSRRRRQPDLCSATMAQKWGEVAEQAMAAAAQGQPVLVGTRSVQASEQVAAELLRRGAAHVVLNARQDAEEAEIVSRAGMAGRITVATNMAGRGTDIKPDAAALAAGGLHVILTEFHESPRVDRQLFGRSARQGEPGSCVAIVSVEDPLFERRAGLVKSLLAENPAPWILRLAVRTAQRTAERRARRIRLQTMKQDRELHRMIGMAGQVT